MIFGRFIGDSYHTQIVYNNFANFFGNDQLKLDLISANNQQFKIWLKWIILINDIYILIKNIYKFDYFYIYFYFITLI